MQGIEYFRVYQVDHVEALPCAALAVVDDGKQFRSFQAVLAQQVLVTPISLLEGVVAKAECRKVQAVVDRIDDPQSGGTGTQKPDAGLAGDRIDRLIVTSQRDRCKSTKTHTA